MEVFQLLFCGNSFGTLKGPERESLLHTMLIPVFLDDPLDLILFIAHILRGQDKKKKKKIAKPLADPRSGPL